MQFVRSTPENIGRRREAVASLRKKLMHFAASKSSEVELIDIAVTLTQIGKLPHPTREPKRKSTADRRWTSEFACESDAVPPDYLCDLARATIERHLPADQYQVLKAAEESEREQLRRWADLIAQGAPAP